MGSHLFIRDLFFTFSTEDAMGTGLSMHLVLIKQLDDDRHAHILKGNGYMLLLEATPQRAFKRCFSGRVQYSICCL